MFMFDVFVLTPWSVICFLLSADVSSFAVGQLCTVDADPVPLMFFDVNAVSHLVGRMCC